MKNCIICGEKKELNDFYKHKQMGDGHLNKCKKCCKSQSKKRESVLRNNKEWCKKEKERVREKYHRLNYKGKHKPSYEQKKESIKKYCERYPEKLNAKNKSQHIKKEGYQKHHWSYREEHCKDIIFLKIKEHSKYHRYIIYDQERMMYRKIDNNILLDTKELNIKYLKELKIEYKI